MITLEKIDAVIAATGADYAAVRQALLASDGDVQGAIHTLQQNRTGTGGNAQETPDQQTDWSAGGTAGGQQAGGPQSASEGQSAQSRFKYQDEVDEVVGSIKEIWKTGNASSLRIEKNGRTVLNLSLTVSAFILILAPLISLIGLGTALLTEYTIKIQMVNGEVIDVLEYTMNHRARREHYEQYSAEAPKGGSQSPAHDAKKPEEKKAGEHEMDDGKDQHVTEEYPSGTSGNQGDAVGGSEGDQQGKVMGDPKDAPQPKTAEEAGDMAASDDKRSKAGLDTHTGDEPYPTDRQRQS